MNVAQYIHIYRPGQKCLRRPRNAEPTWSPIPEIADRFELEKHPQSWHEAYECPFDEAIPGQVGKESSSP